MKDRVAIGVLSIRICPLLYQEVVDSLITKTGSPGKWIFSKIGESFIVSVGGWHTALLIFGMEECSSGSGANISSCSHNNLSKFIITIGNSKV